MIRIICSDVNLFKSSFEAISKIVYEVQMEIDSDGIRLNAIDSFHIMFVHLEIKEKEFDLLECDKPMKIQFETEPFLKYLKRMNKDSTLELRVDGNYLIIHSEGKTNKTFKLKLLDTEIVPPSLPELDYPLTLNIPLKVFKEICSDILEFSHRIKISNNGNIIKFESFGDFADVEIEYEYPDTIQDSYASIYDLEKIKTMLKADKFATKTFISFGNNSPILVEMKSDNNTQNLSFLLAPRIEDEI